MLVKSDGWGMVEAVADGGAFAVDMSGRVVAESCGCGEAQFDVGGFGG